MVADSEISKTLYWLAHKEEMCDTGLSCLEISLSTTHLNFIYLLLYYLKLQLIRNLLPLFFATGEGGCSVNTSREGDSG